MDINRLKKLSGLNEARDWEPMTSSTKKVKSIDVVVRNAISNCIDTVESSGEHLPFGLEQELIKDVIEALRHNGYID